MATRVEAFIDQHLGDELEDGEKILARAYLNSPGLTRKPGRKTTGIIAQRVLGLFGLGFVVGGGNRGRPLAYLGAITDRRLIIIETERRRSGPRLYRRHLFVYGRGDIRMRFAAEEVMVETRGGDTFRWWLDFDDTHCASQRGFFEALAAQAGIALGE